MKVVKMVKVNWEDNSYSILPVIEVGNKVLIVYQNQFYSLECITFEQFLEKQVVEDSEVQPAFTVIHHYSSGKVQNWAEYFIKEQINTYE